jgi:putative flippase GtrA
MVRPLADLYARARQHGPELVKFGVVGGLGTIIDLGGAAVLHSAYHVEPLAAKALSITAATIFTYFGSRFWTFRHRENQPVHREAVLFIALNVVGLIIAEVVIAGTTYGLGLKGPLAYNAASFIGTGLGTIFRWYAYRKWVFLAPAEQPLPMAGVPAAAGSPYHAPWELDPAYLQPGYSAQPAGRFRQAGLEEPFIPNVREASPLLTAPVPAGYAAGPAPYPGPVPAAPRGRAAMPAFQPVAAPGPAFQPAAAASPVPAGSGPRTPGRHRKR